MGLKELRKKHDLTQKQLAVKLKWTRSRVGAIEQLKLDLKKEWAQHIAEFFKMPLKEFMEEYKDGWKEED